MSSVPLTSQLDSSIRLAATALLVVAKHLVPASSKVPAGLAARGDEEYRVLLMQRHGGARFMANVHVFPGGCAESCDEAERWSGALGHGERPADFATRMAAVREVFEESGLLISDHEHLSTAQRGIVKSRRAAVQKDAALFRDACEAAGVAPGLARMHPWSRWVTPAAEKYRYDTFFYLSVVADRLHVADAIEDLGEVTAADWFSPSEALRASAAKAIKLAPPTYVTLCQLANYPTIDALLASLAAPDRKPFEPICPLPAADPDTGRLTFQFPGVSAYIDENGAFVFQPHQPIRSSL